MTNSNATELTSRRLGTTGPTVTSPALGGMSLSGVYGAVDDDEGVRVIHAYLDAGGTLIDTGDFYGAGHNEMLIGRALRERDRDQAVVSVKFGALLDPSGMPVGFDGRPEAVKSSLTYSLQRLGTDHIDIYRPARVDPQVPIEETVGAVKELVDAGYVRHVGLSEVGADTIRRAAAVTPISDLQIEYSVLSRDIETNGILETCRELGIGITAYSVLGRGLIGGSGKVDGSLGFMPRFQGDNLDHNRSLVASLEQMAEEKGATLAQLAMAWVAARGEHIVPVIGSRRVSQIESMIGSNAVALDEADLARIDAEIPAGSVRGDRYPTAFMDQLDSES